MRKGVLKRLMKRNDAAALFCCRCKQQIRENDKVVTRIRNSFNIRKARSNQDFYHYDCFEGMRI
jgi:hypothetical protein